MKKHLALISVLALAACGNSVDVSKHDARFAGWNCERIATNEQHLVYKCPSDLQWIVDLKKNEPNAKFLTWGDDEVLIKETAKDEKVALVEVVLGVSAGCKDDFHYRTMIRPIGEEYWAYLGCD